MGWIQECFCCGFLSATLSPSRCSTKCPPPTGREGGGPSLTGPGLCPLPLPNVLWRMPVGHSSHYSTLSASAAWPAASSLQIVPGNYPFVLPHTSHVTQRPQEPLPSLPLHHVGWVPCGQTTPERGYDQMAPHGPANSMILGSYSRRCNTSLSLRRNRFLLPLNTQLPLFLPTKETNWPPSEP